MRRYVSFAAYRFLPQLNLCWWLRLWLFSVLLLTNVVAIEQLLLTLLIGVAGDPVGFQLRI